MEGAIQVVTLTLARFPRLAGRAWAFVQMGIARPALWRRRRDGLEFWKLCGSGTGEGFTPVPNTAVWAILAVWHDAAAAEAGLARPPFPAWRRRAAETWTVSLAPVSARGTWSQRTPFRPSDAPGGPLAVMTRGTIRPRALRGFWGKEPAVSQAIGRDPNVLFKAGIGEVPWRNQITFSIWPDAAAMTRFSRGCPHAEAVRAVRQGDWFAEELYARFHVTGTAGTWGGACPLAPPSPLTPGRKAAA
jgi:spheroidene monooxygenase